MKFLEKLFFSILGWLCSLLVVGVPSYAVLLLLRRIGSMRQFPRECEAAFVVGVWLAVTFATVPVLSSRFVQPFRFRTWAHRAFRDRRFDSNLNGE